jgi:hypothetical protein
MFSRLTLSPDVATQVVGTDENRVSVTVKSAITNTNPVYLVASSSQPQSQGWELLPGEAYVFGGSGTPYGARAALYALAPVAGQDLYVTTEGQ